MIEKDIDKKLKILSSLHIFRVILLLYKFCKCFEPFSLIPLANTLISQNYTIGEIILNEGEMINSWCIIAEGRVRVNSLKLLKYKF